MKDLGNAIPLDGDTFDSVEGVHFCASHPNLVVAARLSGNISVYDVTSQVGNALLKIG